jgi:hypothetical protein
MKTIRYNDFDSTGHTKLEDRYYVSIWVNDETREEVTVQKPSWFEDESDVWTDWQESQNPNLDVHGN